MAKRKKRNRAAIVGVGMTDFGKHQDKSITDIVIWAYNDAMKNAGSIDHDDIDALIYSSAMAGIENEPTAIPAFLNSQLGYLDRPAFRVEAACSSGAAALRIAIGLIESGLNNAVMVIGFEKQNVDTRQSMMDYARGMDTRYDLVTGFCGPGSISLLEREYMKRYPHCREEDLAVVSAKGHTYALDNPHAPFGRKMSVEDVMKSPYIATPLKQFEVTPICDGASAFIVAREDLARRFTNKPLIYPIGSGLAISPLNMVHIRGEFNINTRYAAKQAFDMAGVSPEQIKVAEIYDCYTYSETVCSEEVGFFKPGQGCIAAREGRTKREGDIPLNVIGGNQGRGHPPGATAGAQVHDLIKQMRGEAGSGQLKRDLSLGMIHELGSTLCIAAVTIFARED